MDIKEILVFIRDLHPIYYILAVFTVVFGKHLRTKRICERDENIRKMELKNEVKLETMRNKLNNTICAHSRGSKKVHSKPTKRKREEESISYANSNSEL